MVQISLLGLWLSVGVMIGSVLAGQLYAVGDLHVTRRMKEAGALLQIELLDHVILGAPRKGDEKSFFSFKNEGLL